MTTSRSRTARSAVLAGVGIAALALTGCVDDNRTSNPDSEQVASKRDALRWSMMHGDPRWRPLLQQVQADRDLGLDPYDEPRPGSLDEARAFAAYVAAVA